MKKELQPQSQNRRSLKMTEDRKIHKITAKQKNILDRAELKENKIFKEQMKYNRRKAIEQNEMMVRSKERMAKFKQSQLDNKESLEIHPEFKDNIKPLVIIENEIESLRFEIGGHKEDIEKLKEEAKKDV